MVFDSIKKLVHYFINSKENKTTAVETTMSTAIVPNPEEQSLQSLYTIVENCLKDNVFWTFGATIVVVLIATVIIIWQRWFNRERQRNLFDNMQFNNNRLRFRKRDKMLFYGRRMLRKVKTLSGQAYNGQGRKRRAVVRFAKRILNIKRDDNLPMLLKTVEPPNEYLEEMVDGSDKVPPDAFCMLQGIRIFGHFEKPIFLKLCKFTEIITLDTNDLLFKIGDIDDSVFIIQSGKLNVLINNSDGTTLSLKHVKRGESVTSLLSFIDVLAGNESVYKSVTAKALEPSQVIRLPMKALKEVFDENPDILVRVIQIIMIRLQRVIFTALRNYLGLYSELVQHKPHKDKRPQQQQQPPPPPSSQQQQQNQQNLKNSPTHYKPRQSFDINSYAHTLSVEPNDFVRPDMLNDLSEVPHQKHSRRFSIAFDREMEAHTVLQMAVDGFIKELGLKDSDRHLLESHIEYRDAEPGITLLRENCQDDVCLLLVLSGSVSVLQEHIGFPGSKNASKEVHSYNSYAGDMIGGLSVLTAETCQYTVRARHHTKVAILSRTSVYNLMRERPWTVVYIANTVVRKLSPLVRQCDYALDWIFMESGRAVYRQDENSDSTYIVLSGRLRSVVTQTNGKKEIVGEYGKGDMVGIVEMITETSRTTTVMAVRDSELARLPEGLFNIIKFKYPAVVTKLISLLSHRILGSMQSKPGSTPLEANPITHKFSTVALVPLSDDVPLSAFAYEIYHSLCAIGPTLRLTSDDVHKALGPGILEAHYEYRLTSWLAQQEDRNTLTLYQNDYALNEWTQRCLRQADVIILVGLGDRTPTVGKFEKEVDKWAPRTQKELVLLHRESIKRPVNTLQWLNVRPWVTKHHHIQCLNRMFTRKSQYRINEFYAKVLLGEPNMHSDFSRFARWLTGNSIGLVLGGGGARGAAHVGMIKAIQDAGIPVDMVGGVSIGAFMGALYCCERNTTTLTQKAREWSKKMTQWHRQLLDLTYPITSMFTGKGFNETIVDTFGDVYIEDLWIPYFTLTTDISASCSRIHTNGSLWRYVRASMSLSGYMPPLCDPKDGHLLLDGGYVNNLPADVMLKLGAAHIIAIDVGSQDDTDLSDYGDSLSGWWLLYKKWNPFSTPVKVPNLPDIQSRLAYVSCVRQLEEVKNSDYCEYIRPPIDRYKTLAFGSFDEIKDVGYIHGRNCFDAMEKSGRLGRFNKWFSKELPKKLPNSLNEYSFIDLAQIVCKVPERVRVEQISTSSSDEEFDGYISEPSNLVLEEPIRVDRTGGSLSLSENDFDSDELDMSLTFKIPARPKKLKAHHLKHSSLQAIPRTPSLN
ncbi:neuropathy target esterase sws isoform X1 [Contarinia nasturtii]|uniref:neuropathy target esterase sws isoform X1 n=1 Tax=Contarinia nasturtii TaxID=265458 RepID=UPI0012D3CD31|nr:neuropathy target esterase sws isoform X1 [Contarinia nasturtii]